MTADRTELDVLARTLFVHDARGRLVRVNEDGGPRAPRAYLAWNAHAVHLAVRDDVPDDLAARLRAAVALQAPTGALGAEPACAAALRAVLAPTAAEGQLEYRFPADLREQAPTTPLTADNAHVLERWLPDWRAYAQQPWPAVVKLVDGHAVAICATVRDPDIATQAGVETHPDFRRHGHAAAVTAAWALAIRARGIVPAYGTSWTNHGSQRVAARLGLLAYAGSLALR